MTPAPFRCHLNPAARRGSWPGLFDIADYARVATFFRARPHLSPTPLLRLSGLARRLELRDLLLKDESGRWGLPAFKVVGVVYAVDRALADGTAAGRAVLACATTGNHGRAVAHIARLRGLEARVYVPATALAARRAAIEAEGAHLTIVDGSYDDTVRRMAAEAAREGWLVVSDTGWDGYEAIPRWIMAGYTQIFAEAATQWEAIPDVVFVQVGVGGLAAAAGSWLAHHYGTDRPYLVACEPAAAACALESVRAGKPLALQGPLETIMAGLRCGEVSGPAWPALARGFDAFVTVPDSVSTEAMRVLRTPAEGDPPVGAGPSGACGLAGLLAVLREDVLRPVREASGLGPEMRVLVINTEGALDE